MKKYFSLIIGALLMSLTACENVPAPYGVNWDGEETPGPINTIIAPRGDGTLENPYNVAGVIAYINTLEADVESPKAVYVKGTISKITTKDGAVAQYGNHSFEMVDKGNTSKVFTAYQVYGPDNKKFTSDDQIKVGDEVIVYGKVVNYKGNTPETVGKGAAYVYSINSTGGGDVTPNPTPDTGDKGTKESPFSVADALAFTSALPADQNSADSYYIKGFVTEIKEAPGNQYGNATFYIADTKGGSPTFYVFRCMYYGGSKFTSADQLKVGDEVVIYGPVVNYKGNTPETVGNKTSIYSINGVTEGTGGDVNPTPDPTPDTPTGSTDGVSIADNVVALTNTAATAGTETETIDLNSLGYENQQDVATVKGTGCTLTFAAGTNSNAPKFYSATKGVRVYANNTITFTGTSKAIAKVEMTCDVYNGVTYVGNATATLAAQGNTLVYTNASETAGTQLRVQTIKVTYAK